MPRRPSPAVPPEHVLDHIGPGADVIVPLGNGEPVGLIDVLEQHGDRSPVTRTGG